MKKKSLIILLVISLIAIVLLAMYLIDRGRMNGNKSVLFSTWGYSYAPPIDTYNENPKNTETEQNYSKIIENITLEIKIPNDWKYEELPKNEENDFYKYALKLYKNSEEEYAMLYFYYNRLGVCGTGRVSEIMILNSGETANIGYYDGSKIWSDISFYSLNKNIAILNYGLDNAEASELIEFVKTIKISTYLVSA